MTRPRILLVPALTRLEWRIEPLLSEWAEVASYDAPGVGDEPPVELLSPQAIVERGMDELERRGWSRCVVAGDEYGIYPAVHIAVGHPELIAGLVLGHACLSMRESGEQAPIDAEMMDAMRRLARLDYKTYARHLTQVTQDAYDDEMANEYVQRVPRKVAGAYWGGATRELLVESMGPLIASVPAPLLLARHEGCLSWTDAGWEDALAAFPSAKTMSTRAKPSCSAEFAEALREFCAELDWEQPRT